MIWEQEEVYLGQWSFPVAEGIASVIFIDGIGEGVLGSIEETGDMFEK
jgi:hypothetical protein